MLSKNKLFFLFFLLCFKGFSQRVEILHNSGFKHNYVVGNLEYIEEIKDTARLKYIATLSVEDKTFYWTGIVVQWLDRIQTEAKKLGANTFCLEKYSEKDSIGTLVVRIYFAGVNFLKENKLKRDQTNIFFFSSFTNTDVDSFFIDKTKQEIDPKKCFSIDATINKEYGLSVNKKIVPRKVKFKDESPSMFFIIPVNKSTLASVKLGSNPSSAIGKMSEPPGNKKNKAIYIPTVVLLPAVGLADVAAILVSKLRKNNLIELDYRDGRFMADVFK